MTLFHRADIDWASLAARFPSQNRLVVRKFINNLVGRHQANTGQGFKEALKELIVAEDNIDTEVRNRHNTINAKKVAAAKIVQFYEAIKHEVL